MLGPEDDARPVLDDRQDQLQQHEEGEADGDGRQEVEFEHLLQQPFHQPHHQPHHPQHHLQRSVQDAATTSAYGPRLAWCL